MPQNLRFTIYKIYKIFRCRKSAFSPRRGDLLHRFKWNLVWPRGTWVRLAVQNFTPIGAWGGNAAPKS